MSRTARGLTEAKGVFRQLNGLARAEYILATTMRGRGMSFNMTFT
jgi:hypothetical protein